MSELAADNLEVSTTMDGRPVFEIQYITFLRENGFTIDGFNDPRVIQSESDESKAYLVGKVQTYTKPKDHPELDVIEDQCIIPVCSCWSFRSNSSDVTEAEEPGGSCKHCREAFMEERAKSDEKQTQL